jgi:hypothetical protein
MQNNRRNLGILLIVIGLIILLLIIYFGFLRKPTTPEGVITPTPTTTAQLPTGLTTGTTTPSDKPRRQEYDLTKEAAHQLNAGDLTKRAMAFSERFGSFSSQSDYNNFTDAKLSMTDSLKDWVDSYVQKLKSQSNSSAYYGIVTTALTAEVKSFDDKAGAAEIIVTTERRESTEKINGGTPYTQKLDLKFLKINGEWLVNEVYWEK